MPKYMTREQRKTRDDRYGMTLLVFTLSAFIVWVWLFYGSPHEWAKKSGDTRAKTSQSRVCQ